MNLKKFSFFLLILCAGSVFSQTPAPVLTDNTVGKPDETYKIGDIRGSIKRKAILLPKPPFPREALEAGADGAVKVEVVLDADGNVISAKTISGHPLLHKTAEETALKSKFRKAETTDPDATETGFIIYNFAIEKAGWLRIGYDLAAIQKIPTLRPLSIPRIAKAFQPEWTGELEILGKLAEMRRVEVESNNNSATSDKPGLVGKNAPTPRGTTQNPIKSELRVQIPIPNPPTPERIALAQNLTASLQSRLGGDDANLWKFNLGINLAKALELFRNPTENRTAAGMLRQFAESAPAGTPAETLTAIKEIIEFFESGRRTVESRAGITKPLVILLNSK